MTHRTDSPSKQEQLWGGKDKPEGTALPTVRLCSCALGTCIVLKPRGEMVHATRDQDWASTHFWGWEKWSQTPHKQPQAGLQLWGRPWQGLRKTNLRKLQCWLYYLGRMCRLHTASSREEYSPDPSHHTFLGQGKQCPFHWLQKAPNGFLRQRPA